MYNSGAKRLTSATYVCNSLITDEQNTTEEPTICLRTLQRVGRVAQSV